MMATSALSHSRRGIATAAIRAVAGALCDRRRLALVAPLLVAAEVAISIVVVVAVACAPGRTVLSSVDCAMALTGGS